MDTSSITGSSQLLRAGQTQQALSATMMKLATNQQNMLADLLAQNVSQSPLPAPKSDDGFNFSTYA